MLSDRQWQGEHPCGRLSWKLRSPGLFQDRVLLLPEGDAHHVPPDQAAQSGLCRGSSGEDGMQGPMAAAAIKWQWSVGLHGQEKSLEAKMMGLE